MSRSRSPPLPPLKRELRSIVVSSNTSPAGGGSLDARRSSRPGTAAFPVVQAGRPPHHPFRGLLGVHSRCGLPARQVAQGNPLHRRLQKLRRLHSCSDCYRLERPVAGWDSNPLRIAAFARRTALSRLEQMEPNRVAVGMGVGGALAVKRKEVEAHSPEATSDLPGPFPAPRSRPRSPASCHRPRARRLRPAGRELGSPRRAERRPRRPGSRWRG